MGLEACFLTQFWAEEFGEKCVPGQVEHAGDHAGALHRVRSSQATSTLLVLDWSYFSREAHLGYHQDTHLGARGALSTLRVVSWSEKAVDKARQFMGKPACRKPTLALAACVSYFFNFSKPVWRDEEGVSK